MATSEERTDNPKPAPVFANGTAMDFILITVLWALAVVLVRPIGDFPLNDDWSMGLTTKYLVEGGGYRPTGWTEMTLITNALWGALFCLPKGFSFTALRFSTLALSLAGGLAAYGLVRQLGRPRLMAMLVSLLLVFNPLYFALSNTFMTDVPFTTLAILSAWCFVRELQQRSNTALLLGTLFAVLATLSRQMGLCLPLAYAASMWLRHGFDWRRLLRAALPVFACVVILAGFQHWVHVAGNTPVLNNQNQQRRFAAVLTDPIAMFVNVFYFGWSMLMYLGLFLLPMMLPQLWKLRRSEKEAPPSLPLRIALFLFALVSLARFIFFPRLMPVHNNILAPYGIGPATLRDTLRQRLTELPGLPIAFWLVVTALSLVGAILFIVKTVRAISAMFSKGKFNRADNEGLIGMFFLLCTAAYLAPFLISGYFDRYLVPVTLFLAAFWAVRFSGPDFMLTRPQACATWFLIAGFAVYSVAGTRDYLESNRTQWRATQTLLQLKDIKAKDIDGGAEFNGWHLPEIIALAGSTTNELTLDYTYALAFAPAEGFDPVSTNAYRKWLPPHEGKFLVLKRKGR
jgi:hypothetical protein